MNKPSMQDGITLAVLEKLETQVMPRINEIKSKTDQGELISEREIEFLTKFLK